MTLSKVQEISEAWEKAGSQSCRHSFADSLESDEGRDMGTSVCAVCGSHMPGLLRLAAIASAND